MTDPNRWQPLQLEHMISQNGIPVRERRPAGRRPALGPRAGLRARRPAATTACRSIPGRRRSSAGPGDRTQAYKDQAVEVIRDSSLLDAASDETIDISPGVLRRQLAGHQRRARATRSTRPPASRTTPNLVKRGDFTRALTEFWADGPKSETPPGHWNVVANEVGDALGPEPADRRQGDARRPRSSGT